MRSKELLTISTYKLERSSFLRFAKNKYLQIKFINGKIATEWQNWLHIQRNSARDIYLNQNEQLRIILKRQQEEIKELRQKNKQKDKKIDELRFYLENTQQLARSLQQHTGQLQRSASEATMLANSVKQQNQLLQKSILKATKLEENEQKKQSQIKRLKELCKELERKLEIQSIQEKFSAQRKLIEEMSKLKLENNQYRKEIAILKAQKRQLMEKEQKNLLKEEYVEVYEEIIIEINECIRGTDIPNNKALPEQTLIDNRQDLRWSVQGRINKKKS